MLMAIINRQYTIESYTSYCTTYVSFVRSHNYPANEFSQFSLPSGLFFETIIVTMKLSIALLATAISGTTSFVVQPTPTSISSTSLNAEEKEKFAAVAAEIRGPTKKNDVLEFGWDGTTALGGAVDDSKPARFLDDIRASGETQSEACDLFNANLGKYVVNEILCISCVIFSSISVDRAETNVI